MKKSELKELIKPIVEECIRESLFKEGMLSSIISEVMIGITKEKPIVENKTPQAQNNSIKELNKNKKKLLDEIGRDAFKGVDIFEGTTPAPSSGGNTAYSATKDMDPNDPGINIDGLVNVMGNTWKTLAKGNK